MAHLHYHTLGAPQGYPGGTIEVDGVTLTGITTNPFWSSTEKDDSLAFAFNFWYGNNGDLSKILTSFPIYGWAVRDGDIGAVPVPAAVWLFGSGLLGLIGSSKRK